MPFESTVHVIDDDEALRDSLTFLLRTARLDVQSYPSAMAFLQMTRQDRTVSPPEYGMNMHAWFPVGAYGDIAHQ